MKKLFLFFLTVLLTSAVAMAQHTVTGTVLSEQDNEPIIGATVRVLGNEAIGVATDADGHFSLQVPAQFHKLIVSSVGMTTRTVDITSAPMTIILSDHATHLDDVMVVAYGTAKKSEYTGSASVVKAADISDALVSSVTSVLSGKVSGVQTISSDGRPGSAPSIRIRGIGSINASSSPLYVVDGVPYEGDISQLANSDVESMTILKDAASTALYGARGANGVVLITTKRGAEGSARVTFDARWGANTVGIDNYNVISNPEQYMEMAYQGYYNYATLVRGANAATAWNYANNQLQPLSGSGGVFGYQIYEVPTGERLIGHNGKINPNAQLGYSDGTYYYLPDNWRANTLHNGLRHEYNLSISGGTEKLKYYVSGSYLGDDGVINGSSFDRFSSRATVDYQAKKWLKIGTNTAYIYTKTNYASDNDLDNSTSSGNAFWMANMIAPIYPMFVRDAATRQVVQNEQYGLPVYDYGDGSSTNYTRNWMSMANPIGTLRYDTYEILSDAIDTKWYATITPIDGLNITGTAGYFTDNTRYHLVNNPFYGQGAEGGGYAMQQAYRSRSLNLQALASYTHTFANAHTMDVMVGYENYSYNTEYVYAGGYNLYSPTGWNVTNTIDRKTGNGGSEINYTTRGIFARAKYNYEGRYFFHASYRRDASSVFAPEHRWGDFFSVSAGWDIAKESFMQNATAVDQLKLKVSFGQNGNDKLSGNMGRYPQYYYAWQDQYKVNGANGVWNDATLVYKGNPNITWETSNAFNAGVDFSFFQGRLSGTVEYFSRQTSNMLFNLPASPSLGYSTYPENVGSMRNSGFELELNGTVVNTKNVTLDLNFNITTLNNKILKLADKINGQWVNGYRLYREGEAMAQWYMPSYAGVNPDNGLAQYWGMTTDGKEEPVTDWNLAYAGGTDKATGVTYVANRKASGSLLPKAYGGFGATLNVYGIDLSVSFAYQFGGKIYDNTYAYLMHGINANDMGQNWHQDMLNAWTPENRNTDVPRLCAEDKYTTSVSDRWFVSSNYLSLNNLTLGYTFPKQVTDILHLESVRIYGAAENLALWTKRKGLDPRQSYTSSNNATYSPIRAFSGGIRVTF